MFILSPSVRASCYTVVYRVPYWPNREHLLGCSVIVTRSTVSMSVGTPLPPFMLQWRARLVFASQFSLCFSAQQACLCWYFTSSNLIVQRSYHKPPLPWLYFLKAPRLSCLGLTFFHGVDNNWKKWPGGNFSETGRILNPADPTSTCNCHSLTMHTEGPSNLRWIKWCMMAWCIKTLWPWIRIMAQCCSSESGTGYAKKIQTASFE